MTDKFSDEFLGEVGAVLKRFSNLKDLNKFLENKTGIIDFFESSEKFKEFNQFLDDFHIPNDTNKDLGDFQTPSNLTDKICKYLINTGLMPDAIVEPTCGEGNFIISAIKFFPSLKYIYCVENQYKYEWFFKLNILKFSFNQKINTRIEFHRDNIFKHQFSDAFIKFLDIDSRTLLILGNPPWVTSSDLSALNSNNLPPKTNIKRYRGIEAITGKSNFDIAEYIILQMIQRFSGRMGKIAMLCKTSVSRNIIRSMAKLSLKISNIKELLIDARKEFNISTDAGLFVADLNPHGETFCVVSSLYRPNVQQKKYGWKYNKFVSDVDLYNKYGYLDGKSSLEWRHGIKHDASKVMILKITDGSLMNSIGEHIEVEEDLLYPFVRGSELKVPVITKANSKIIITQKKPNEDTNYIAQKYPKLWNYLISHSEYFDKRKSRIYKRRFSIFGIGEYSFKPYKVAIAGLYKEPTFSLILPINNKPVIPDDTCYYLSFVSLSSAFFTWILLNTDAVKHFLSSIVFLDSKRPYTKEVLMRLDMLKLMEKISFDTILNVYKTKIEKSFEYDFTKADFLKFKDFLKRGGGNNAQYFA